MEAELQEQESGGVNKVPRSEGPGVQRSQGPEVSRSKLLRQGLLAKISGGWHRERKQGWSLEWYWSALGVSGGGAE